MINPFTIGIVTGKDFCDRIEEKKTLLRHIKNSQNVVLYAKRLIGKSSLVKQVLNEITEEGILTAYANVFSISSENDFIDRLAASIASGINRRAADHRKWNEKFADLFSRIRISPEVTPQGIQFSIGFDRSLKFSILLEDLMRGLYAYVEKQNIRAVIALDEFQEVTSLPNSKMIEGVLRQYMQEHRNISYIYIGSRRRTLLEMFTDKKRPFYKSAYTQIIEEIPKQDFALYITAKFEESKKKCPLNISEMIYNSVRGYSYYVQKLASLCWGITEKICTEETVKMAYGALIKMEAISDFEGILDGLSMGQKSMVIAIAKEPIKTPFAKDYLNRHNLSQGTAQKAIKVLIKRDIIEKHEGCYRTTDPVFDVWLKGTIAGIY
ncbi:MAG: AAA family ATPase [Nitrospirota bacterium]